MALSKDLIAASSTPIVLSILAEGESYGYAIIKKVNQLSEGSMNWTDGMLYPVLHRLEQKRLVRSHWRVSETGRRRKYYSLTRKGATALQRHKSQWGNVLSTLRKLWEDEPCLT